MDELIDELAQALDAIDKTALLYRELLLSYEEKKLTKKEIVQLSQALADYVTAGVALMGLLDANIEDNARDKWNSARLRLGDAQNVATHTAKRYKKGFEDAQHLAEEDSVFRSIMSLIDGAYSDAMQHFEGYEIMRDANRAKTVDSPKARNIRRKVNFLKDLSFLDKKSWPKRVDELQKIVAIEASEQKKISELEGISERYIINVLKEMPEVQEYLS